uniref:UBX domain protein 2B n=1 Tax=Ursus americanus TaxID=9643 RepID=A0A452RVV0_URSAM
MAEGGGTDPGEQERSSGPRPPSARDLQLALAELYEDEVKCKSSKSDRPKATVFKSPRTPPQSHLQVEDTGWVIPFVSGLNTSMEKINCKMFRFCLNYGAMVSV